MQHTRIEHRFVEHIPERLQLQAAVLYVSVEYATAVHLCCCGCGEEVVTPFTPTDWRMVFDGETISLWPSVGNWDFGCRSHYLIERGRVIRAGPLSDEKIVDGRRADKAAKANFYSERHDGEPVETIQPRSNPDVGDSWLRFKRWLRRRS